MKLSSGALVDLKGQGGGREFIRNRVAAIALRLKGRADGGGVDEGCERACIQCDNVVMTLLCFSSAVMKTTLFAKLFIVFIVVTLSAVIYWLLLELV